MTKLMRFAFVAAVATLAAPATASPKPVSIATAPRPNPFATALQIGGALLDFGQQYSQANRKPTGAK